MGKTVLENKNLFCLPWTQAILGTHLGGKPNFMALDWMTRTNYDPPMLGICVNKMNASYGAIVEKGEFSVNVPTADMMEITDYTGLVSGKRTDKSGLFEIFYGDLKAAPMIRDCPITIECRVGQVVDLPTNGFFIAEIVNVHVEESCMTGEVPDPAKVKPFLLSMPDNRFWALGQEIGKAWSAGKAMRDRLKGEEAK